jgi:hypothetical protein
MIQASSFTDENFSFGFAALRRVRVPGTAGFRLDMGEAGARRRVGDADEMLAGRALDLASRVARVARERLITVRTVEFEFSRVHRISAGQKLRAYAARTRHELHMKNNKGF